MAFGWSRRWVKREVEEELRLRMEKSKSYPAYSSISMELQDQSPSNSSYNFNGPPNEKTEGFAASTDPELKRKKRIASYNVYTMEGKLKSSFRNTFKWIKTKITHQDTTTSYGMWPTSSCCKHRFQAFKQKLVLYLELVLYMKRTCMFQQKPETVILLAKLLKVFLSLFRPVFLNKSYFLQKKGHLSPFFCSAQIGLVYLHKQVESNHRKQEIFSSRASERICFFLLCFVEIELNLYRPSIVFTYISGVG